MAEKNRADLQIVIDSNLPDNTTDFITPELHREVEEDLKDSNFNKLDEPRDIAQDIAFVSPDGDDIEAKLGDMSSPFQTIQAGIDAVDISANGLVHVLGGSYSENLVINQSNLTVLIEGISLTGRLVKQGGSNVYIKATNSFITSNSIGALIVQNTGITVRGGTWEGTGAVSALAMQSTGGGIFIGCTFRSNTATCVTGDSTYFESCDIESTSAVGASLTDLSNMKNCRVVGATNGLVVVDTTVKLDNCYIEGGNNGMTGQNTNDFEYNVIAFNRTRIKGLNGYGLRLLRNCEKISFENCTISGTTDCIDYFNDVERLNNAVNQFKGCTLFAGTGEIINEQAYNVADTGTALFANNIINKAFPVFNKASESYTTLDVNLTEVD